MQSTFGGNLSVEVKFDSLPSERFQDQGILLEESDGDVLRFDIYSIRNNTIGYGASSPSEDGAEERLETVVRPSGPHRLRLTRTGDRWLQELSTDGAI